MELIEKWINNGFTYQQCQDWINIGLVPQDYVFVFWLQNIKSLTPEKVLNEHQEEALRQEFQQLIQSPQEKNLLQQIQNKKNELGQLINSAKEKLKSKKLLISEEERKKRTKERESFLDTFLVTQERIVYPGKSIIEENKFQLRCKLQEIKESLSKKLTMEELDELCQMQIELTGLRLELENLQNQQSQQTAQILQTNQPYGTPSSSK